MKNTLRLVKYQILLQVALEKQGKYYSGTSTIQTQTPTPIATRTHATGSTRYSTVDYRIPEGYPTNTCEKQENHPQILSNS